MAILRSIQQLEARGDEWNALADAVGHPLLRHEWFVCAARTLHAGDELVIVADLGEDGRLAGVAPLVRTRRSGFSRLEALGAATLHEPSGFLCPDPARRTALMQRVLGLKEAVLIQRALPDTLPPLPPAQSTTRWGLLLSRPGAPCLGIALNGRSADYYVESLPGKLRYDIRRARARAEELGPVTCDVSAPDPNNVMAFLADFAAVEGSGWKGRRGSALGAKPALRSFFEMYSASAAKTGSLRLFFLRIAGKIAAVQLAVEIYERLWVLKIGYDEAVARCSPGLILTAEAVRYAARRGLKSYEFLGTVEPWEERWRPELRTHRNIVFYPWTPSGCVRVSLDAISVGWGRMRRVPAMQA